MRKTTLLTTAALLLGGAARTLAQTTDPSLGNEDTPFVRNIRPDRPGQTITTNMLNPGQFQLETGISSQPDPFSPGSATSRSLSTGLLRVGFFNNIELRVAQRYLAPLPPALATEPGSTEVRRPSGLTATTVGAKFLASTTPNARSQVVVLAEMTLRNGDPSLQPTQYEPAARLLVSQQLGERFGLEANFGFRQRGFKAADTKLGTYLGTLALNGPLTKSVGFFAETYATWQQQSTLAPGVTSGLYWRPWPGLRLDVNAGKAFSGAYSGTTVGAGLSLRVGR
ncbi:transporter [Hymenobacter chitinivorans]|uniref:Outer membrane putative beta-barrel porin/alpha-amylase n=1 Tax=Hymenobacter chitinivorans DSM 11115 TaxID=1121954 RepID=A0A2M9BP17_9BACT|nr:transporter [Hymenobacter chitinivorans]PJJ59677.1 outer membrane putative beta-barrel porin/alpha-amylase [Hymenobacter chitinivorans DSM 11115]